jgi:hypothetical protein
MANKRTLKRAINLICEELFSECVAASLYGADKHTENAEAMLFSILKMESDFISRVSHPEPGMPPRIYYKKLREQFAAHASDLADQVNNM